MKRKGKNKVLEKWQDAGNISSLVTPTVALLRGDLVGEILHEALSTTKLSLATGTCPQPLRIKSRAATAADLQCPLKGVQAGDHG